MTNTQHCPALLISAASSGQGKTTVTAALARLHRNAGRHVRVFKTGPDFLDPMILAQASGNPVYQLDLWMAGEAHCRELLYNAAKEADIILIEGVMGLFDGKSSSADLAKLFNIPVLAVINASAMAQTFGALAYGLANYDKDLPFAGVLANRVASENHKDMLVESLPDNMDFYGAIFRDESMVLPSRHLGLTQAQEVKDLDERLENAAKTLTENSCITLPASIDFSCNNQNDNQKNNQNNNRKQPYKTLLEGKHIAVARDNAFSFVYPANLDLLKAMGATLHYFSPLIDDAVPSVDCVYLPGGYPELHLDKLSNNKTMIASIQQHAKENKPIVAECGGMLYLLETLTDKEGHSANMLGLMQGVAVMQNKLANLGMHSMETADGEIHGHTYHHSKMTTTMHAVSKSLPQRKKGRAEPIFKEGNIHASYLHLYLASNPLAAAKLFSPTPS